MTWWRTGRISSDLILRKRKLYHFIDAKFGIEDIREQRLKISEIKNLNDPFELLSLELKDEKKRRDFYAFKEKIARKYGVLCFSSRWSNPLVWSHYADKHRGLCLEFEAPSDHCFEVAYTGRRLAYEVRNPSTSFDQAFMKKLLGTKFASWKHESEVRILKTLEKWDNDKKAYFESFGDSLRLTAIIVGPRSEVSRAQVADALQDYPYTVDRFKARLAFKSFRVVRNKNETLWK